MNKDVEVICQNIREETESKIKEILDNAKKEATKILEEVRNEGEKEKEEILKEMEKDLEEMKGKSSSSLNMEKKRVILEEKGKFIEKVIDEVKKKATQFRKNKKYTDFLRKAIDEGIRVIGKNKVMIFYSPQDKKIFNENFLKEIEGDVSIEFKEGDFEDIGVIVSSPDGSISYDNRFSSRLKRIYDEIYLSLTKEVSNA